MEIDWLKITIIGYLALLLAACSQAGTPVALKNETITPVDPDQVDKDVAVPTKEESMPEQLNRFATKLPERVPPAEAIPSSTGEVPAELLNSILKDLADRTGTDPAKISIIQAQTTIWNDGSLGCAKPGEFYTQALIDGYWVVLEIDERKFDYRVASTGYYFLCENGIPPVSPLGTPGSSQEPTK